MPEKAPADAGWHLKREIQLGHLLTTVTMAASIAWYVGEIKKDVEILKAQGVTQHERDQRQDQAHAEAVALLRAQLSRMDDKLDRLLEARRK